MLRQCFGDIMVFEIIGSWKIDYPYKEEWI
jgi:hypothetical protein